MSDPDVPFVAFAVDPAFRLIAAHSVADVAAALGMDSDRFFFVVQHADDGSYYKNFTIPKKKGGTRLISAPKKGLGIAQTRLAMILQKKYAAKPFVQGYVKGRSFLSNAKLHERQRWILNVDIQDFYPSISFARVRGLFMSRAFGFNDRVATILARITTTANGLPQGARTSPIIANLIAYNLDKRLVGLASKHRLTYSRYADDITFSSSRKQVPSELVHEWAQIWPKTRGFGARPCRCFPFVRLFSQRCKNSTLIPIRTPGSHGPCCQQVGQRLAERHLPNADDALLRQQVRCSTGGTYLDRQGRGRGPLLGLRGGVAFLLRSSERTRRCGRRQIVQVGCHCWPEGAKMDRRRCRYGPRI